MPIPICDGCVDIYLSELKEFVDKNRVFEMYSTCISCGESKENNFAINVEQKEFETEFYAVRKYLSDLKVNCEVEQKEILENQADFGMHIYNYFIMRGMSHSKPRYDLTHAIVFFEKRISGKDSERDFKEFVSDILVEVCQENNIPAKLLIDQCESDVEKPFSATREYKKSIKG